MLTLYTNPLWDGRAKTITKGGTATRESCNAPERNESMSHPWGSSGIPVIREYILGKKTIKAQQELIQIKPLDFGENLTWAKGKVPTDEGNIEVS